MRLPLALCALAFIACTRSTVAPIPVAATASQAPGMDAGKPVAEKTGKPMVVPEIVGRRIDISVTARGYEPSAVAVSGGEQVTLVFTRTVESHCLSEIAIPSLQIKKPLPLDTPVAVPFSPVKSGDVVFGCGMDMVHGLIAVK